MKNLHFLLVAAALVCSVPAHAQIGSPVGPNAPCSAFGTASGTCAQGNDTRITGAAPTASPTFTGTVTGPDAGTWNSSGITASVHYSGTSTHTAGFNSSSGFTTSGGSVANTPSTITLDMSGVNGRLYTAGADTSTNGTFVLQSVRSAGSNSLTVISTSVAGIVTFPQTTTGTNADFACIGTGGILQLQSTACTISSVRFKENIKPYSASALASIMDLRVYTYRLKKTVPANKDPNATTAQLGLTAENIAKVMPLCAIYENDLKTPKSYRQECVIAYLVKGEQELAWALILLAIFTISSLLLIRVAKLERRR